MKYEFIPLANLISLQSVTINLMFILFLIPFLYVCSIYLIDFIEKIKASKKNAIINKKFPIIAFIIIFLGKIPYLLAFFPGVMTIDSLNTINLYENGVLYNNHPVIFTYFFGFIYDLGKSIFNSGTAGICTFIIFQIIIIALILTILLNYLNKKGVNKIIIYLLLAYFALSPDFGYMSVTLWKDVLFGIAFIPLILLLTKFANDDTTQKRISLKYLIIFAIISLMIIFFRNNGIYVFILTTIALFILFKKNKWILSCTCISLIAVYYIITGPVYNVLNVTPGRTVESYSVLLQQIGRVYLKEGNIDAESDVYFRKLIDTDSLEEKYVTWIADPMKGLTNNDKLSETQSEFFKHWFKTLLKNPIIYIESFLSSSLGYWYPDVVYISVRESSQDVAENYDVTKHGIYQKSLLPTPFVNAIRFSTNKIIPISMIIWSLGFSFIILITSFILSLYFKINKQLLIIYIPLVSLWLTNIIAAPVYCEYRYIWGLIVCNVLLICTPIFYKNLKEVEKCKK